MAKRRLKRVSHATNAPDSKRRLRLALTKLRKNDLVDLLIELAGEDRRLCRQLFTRCDAPRSFEEIVQDTREAIIQATDFDPRDVNHNFPYDVTAYDEVKRNLTKLIGLDHLPAAMELSIELMTRGSRQVEASDEGLMTEEIQE